MIQLIGVSGKICSGKTTVSKALIEKYGYKRVVIAEPIKMIARFCKDYLTGVLHDEDSLTYILREVLYREGDFTKTIVNRADMARDMLMYDVFPHFRKADWSVEKNNDIRLLYQMIGEKMRQAFGDDIWVRAMIQRIKRDQAQGINLFICDDVRQKSEFTTMKDFGFQIVRLEISPEVQAERIKNLYGYIEPERLKHISEVNLDDVTNFDLVVNSDNPTDTTLAAILEFIDSWR